MSFENPQILTEELPSVERLRFQRLHPNHLKVGYAGTVLFFLFLLGGIFLLVGLNPFFQQLFVKVVLGSLWIVWFTLSMWLVRKNYRVEGFALRERDLIHKKGVLWHTQTALPFNRVQHLEIRQGPLEKYFGLCTLKLFTAGGQSSDLSISGIGPEEAQRLKAYIIRKTAADEEE